MPARISSRLAIGMTNRGTPALGLTGLHWVSMREGSADMAALSLAQGIYKQVNAGLWRGGGAGQAWLTPASVSHRSPRSGLSIFIPHLLGRRFASAGHAGRERPAPRQRRKSPWCGSVPQQRLSPKGALEGSLVIAVF